MWETYVSLHPLLGPRFCQLDASDDQCRASELYGVVGRLSHGKTSHTLAPSGEPQGNHQLWLFFWMGLPRLRDSRRRFAGCLAAPSARLLGPVCLHGPSAFAATCQINSKTAQ